MTRPRLTAAQRRTVEMMTRSLAEFLDDAADAATSFRRIDCRCWRTPKQCCDRCFRRAEPDYFSVVVRGRKALAAGRAALTGSARSRSASTARSQLAAQRTTTGTMATTRGGA